MVETLTIIGVMCLAFAGGVMLGMEWRAHAALRDINDQRRRNEGHAYLGGRCVYCDEDMPALGAIEKPCTGTRSVLQIKLACVRKELATAEKNTAAERAERLAACQRALDAIGDRGGYHGLQVTLDTLVQRVKDADKDWNTLWEQAKSTWGELYPDVKYSHPYETLTQLRGDMVWLRKERDTARETAAALEADVAYLGEAFDRMKDKAEVIDQLVKDIMYTPSTRDPRPAPEPLPTALPWGEYADGKRVAKIGEHTYIAWDDGAEIRDETSIAQISDDASIESAMASCEADARERGIIGAPRDVEDTESPKRLPHYPAKVALLSAKGAGGDAEEWEWEEKKYDKFVGYYNRSHGYNIQHWPEGGELCAWSSNGGNDIAAFEKITVEEAKRRCVEHWKRQQEPQTTQYDPEQVAFDGSLPAVGGDV